MKRNTLQKVKDFLTFPLRALTLFENDKWSFSSLASERFDYVSKEVIGYCLDVGCGRHNRFISEYLHGNGKGIDIYPYDGLTKENLVEDITHFPFEDKSFESITFIANFNHIPIPMRNIEVGEAYRCLKSNGKIIITMGHPLAEILAHQVVFLYDRLFRTEYDLDSERGMNEEETLYVHDSEIIERLQCAGFKQIEKKYFFTQWGLNHLLAGRKI